MRWRNANIETEKSEQTPFAQIFLSQYYYLFNVCAVKRFKDCNTKLDHAKLLSSSIFLCRAKHSHAKFPATASET